MGEGLRMVVGDRAFDGSPLSQPSVADICTTDGTLDERLTRHFLLIHRAREAARLETGRAPYAPMLRPVFGPDAPTRHVLTQHEDGSYGAGTVQVVPRIRIDWL